MKETVEKIDVTKLNGGLLGLRGKDFSQAEREARRMGETMPMIQFSGTFQAILAAKAMGVSPTDIDDLPIGEYVSIITKVSNFLFSDMVPEAAVASKSTTR